MPVPLFSVDLSNTLHTLVKYNIMSIFPIPGPDLKFRNFWGNSFEGTKAKSKGIKAIGKKKKKN